MVWRRPATRLPLALAALALATGAVESAAEERRPSLGVMGTIPIYWGEARTLGDLVSGSGRPHWARAALERDYTLRPLDTLDPASLAGVSYLLLAQPRALSGAENVALDAWVRAGGHLLLFADPLMTGESAFPLGDRRRPQDVALLSPILGHWGLRFEFDADQPPGPRIVRQGTLALPVEMAGRFALATMRAPCTLSAEAVLARCALGNGTAMIVADAALLDLYDPDPIAAAALTRLESLAYGHSGEIAGP